MDRQQVAEQLIAMAKDVETSMNHAASHQHKMVLFRLAKQIRLSAAHIVSGGD